jgi:hypothetical protein
MGEKKRWKYMINLRTIRKRLGTACVSLKMTESRQQGQELHKVLTPQPG